MPLKIPVYFDKDKCIGYVGERRHIMELDKRWFGRVENNVLFLDIVELTYLLLKNRIVIIQEGNNVINDFNSFLRGNYECIKEFFWPKLIVYRDLRDRGRRVRIIDERRFLVKDKYGDLRIVIVLEEGYMRKANTIPEDIESAHKNGLKLVYAIVSLQGDLTYYEVSKIEPRRE